MKPDVVVIGGGLAGGAAATLLARTGRRVLLLEREPGSHHKVCGEFLSIEAQRILATLGLDLDALGAETITQTGLTRGASAAVGPLPFMARSVSRYELDEALLRLAEAAGASIRRGAAVTGLAQTGTGWQISLGGEVIDTDTVMLATGKHDLRGFVRAAQPGPDYIGFKMYFRDAARVVQNQVLLTLFDGGYAGLEQVEGDRLNLCLVVDKQTYARANRDWPLFYENLLQLSSPLRAALASAKPLWPKPLAIAQIPYGFIFRGETPHGLYRLGDQAAVIPSFCGDGMAIALHSAVRAAEQYLAQGPVGAATYQATLAQQLAPQFARAAWLNRVARQPFLSRLFIALAQLCPGLLGKAAALTRLTGWQGLTIARL